MSRDVLLERGLPHSADAEHAILGAVLLNNSLIDQVGELLCINDFHLTSHQEILKAMLSLSRQSMPIDLLTLKADLEARNCFEQVGGLSYLTSLIDGVPRNDTIECYARIVRRHSRARRLISAANHAIIRATDGEDDLNTVAVELRRSLEELKTSSVSDVNIVCLADVQAESILFLWKPFIPMRKLTLVEGDPGVGKSWFACAIATATAAGRGPDGWASTEPRDVLLLSVEDGLADTIRPRLDSMGADVERIHALEGSLTLNDSGIAVLEEHINKVKPALVVIDPLVTYLGAHVDLHRANEVRAVMARLASIAERYGSAIVGIRHLSKSGKDRAIYRGLGSIDFTAVARSVLLLGCDPDESAKRAVVHIKSNLAELGRAVGYEIRLGRFYWTKDSNLTAERMLGAATRESERSTLGDAKDFLREVLANGPLPSEEVQRKAQEAGITNATLRRAKQALGINGKPNVFKVGQPGTDAQRWLWRLPVEDVQSDGEDAQEVLIERLRPTGDDKDAWDEYLTEAAHESSFAHLRGTGEQLRADELEVISERGTHSSQRRDVANRGTSWLANI